MSDRTTFARRSDEGVTLRRELADHEGSFPVIVDVLGPDEARELAAELLAAADELDPPAPPVVEPRKPWAPMIPGLNPRAVSWRSLGPGDKAVIAHLYPEWRLEQLEALPWELIDAVEALRIAATLPKPLGGERG